MRLWRQHDRSPVSNDDTPVNTGHHSGGTDHGPDLDIRRPLAEVRFTVLINYEVDNRIGQTKFAVTQLPCVEDTTPQSTTPTVHVPSELLYHGWATLFPAERMAVIGGRRTGRSVTLGPVFDVTSEGPGTTSAHVWADPNRLRDALIALERAGAHLAGWIHSHPGFGAEATQPSLIDRAQHRDWVRDYSPALISLIVVGDGVVRLWGSAIEADAVRIQFVGTGITPVAGYKHVYRLAR